MSRLVVMTTSDLAVGYRLAGAATIAVGSATEAEEHLVELLRHETGVIALHAPYFDQLTRAMRREIDRTDTPLVVPLPGGAVTAQAEDRRARLLRMLRQAVGYEITFDSEGTSR